MISIFPKKTPEKNYILAAIVLLISIFAIFYIIRWYAVYREDDLNKAIISDYLNELSYDEFSNYLIENSNAVIYMGIANDIECRKFENKLKNIVESYNLKESITYLNVTDFSRSDENYITKFNDKYSDEVKISEIPIIIVFENGKIDKILEDDLSTARIISFLNKNDVIIN